MIITPTIGRKVWFRPNGSHPSTPSPLVGLDMRQPMDATIVYVYGDRMVNLCVTDHTGHKHAIPSVTLRQEGDFTPGGMYCEWMPFQTGQVKKEASLLGDLNNVRVGTPLTGTPPAPKWVPNQPYAWSGIDDPLHPRNVVTCHAASGLPQTLAGTGQLSQ